MDRVTTRPLYEAHIEIEEGSFLTGPEAGRTWRGYRVKYRESGSRGRWRKFLLIVQAEPPTIEQLQLACHTHAVGPAARGER